MALGTLGAEALWLALITIIIISLMLNGVEMIDDQQALPSFVHMIFVGDSPILANGYS